MTYIIPPKPPTTAILCGGFAIAVASERHIPLVADMTIVDLPARTSKMVQANSLRNVDNAVSLDGTKLLVSHLEDFAASA